jgi:hypothetical protein
MYIGSDLNARQEQTYMLQWAPTFSQAGSLSIRYLSLRVAVSALKPFPGSNRVVQSSLQVSSHRRRHVGDYGGSESSTMQELRGNDMYEVGENGST